MATEVIKVVDPDNGSGTDYTSLSAWEAGEQQDLVANDRIATAKCICTSGSADTTRVSIDGWTTDSTHYIKIWTDPTESYRHNGKWNETKYRLEVNVGGATNLLYIGEENVRIDGLQLYAVSATAEVRLISVGGITGTADIRISNSIIRYNNSGTYAGHGIWITKGGSGSTAKIWNNIIYDMGTVSGNPFGSVGIKQYSTAHFSVYAYNNTVLYSYYGYGTDPDYTSFIAKNNIAQNCTDGFFSHYGSFNSASDYNLSDISGDAPGSHSRNGVTVTFVDKDNKDFHLAETDTGARNYGANLSSDSYLAFSDDIDGQTRPGETAWDIGADEYAPTSVTLTQSAYRFFNDDGSESGSTPAVSENTGITYTRESNLRIRIQVSADGNPPSQQYQLEYAIQGGNWEKITS